MTRDVKELKLGKSYSFSVIVDSKGTPYSGKLELSPQKITLSISGDQTSDRSCGIKYGNIEQLICTNTNQTFILNRLRSTSWRSNTISRYPTKVGHLEINFDVEHIVYIPTESYQESFLSNIEIHSKTIYKWIGSTEKQQEIINNHSVKEIIDDSPEFSCRMGNVGFIGVYYNTSIHYSLTEFSSGVVFPPVVHLGFSERKSSKNIKNYYDKIYNIFSVFTGDELDVDKIVIDYSGASCIVKGSLYYPSLKIPKRRDESFILFPLSRNLCWDQLQLPAFPLDAFNEYIELNKIASGYWEKYIKYRRMENTEDRFLGYFRLLESLIFNKKNYLDEEILIDLVKKSESYLVKIFNDKKNVKSFLKGLQRYNSSKYNTEKNIQDFLKTLPSNLTETWVFSKKNIGEICKLRNDITHANDYYSEEIETEGKTKFIEVLLLLKLFSRDCGVIFIKLKHSSC